METAGYYIEEAAIDVEEVVPLTNSFYDGEPLATYIGLSNEETEEILKQLVTKWSKSGICILARSEYTGAIVGTLFGESIKEEDHLIWGAIKSENKKIKYFARVNGILEESVNIHKMCDCSVVFEFTLMCLDKDHRGKGIGLMMAKATYIGLSNEETEEILKQLFAKWAKSGICILARSEYTGAIVGTLIGESIKEEDHLIWGAITSENKKIKYFARVNAILEESVNIHKMCDCSVVFEFALMCVDKDHRGKGIGLMMAKKMEQIARNKGFDVFSVTATNLASRKIFQKLGYKIVFEYDYKQLELTGKKLFDISFANGTTSATILVKQTSDSAYHSVTSIL